jgi:acetyl-CoA decarbonylase/synthase complex subunit delta
MPFTNKPQVFNASINTVSFGGQGCSVTLGGANVYPLYTFDAAIANMPKIGVEVSDLGCDASIPGLSDYYRGAATVIEQAARAAAMEGADLCAEAGQRRSEREKQLRGGLRGDGQGRV